jgi:uncharacterized protein (DUF1697 family)
MTRYIGLLRAVNVGGTTKLAMTDLKALCRDAGFERVETIIASGNVVFDSKASAAKVKSTIEKHLHELAGKPIGVIIRTAAEMRAVIKANPFPKTNPRYTVAIFLDRRPEADTLSRTRGRTDEEMHLGKREVYVYYPSGQGRSKLSIPGAETGTARNMNTVAKLVAVAEKA